MPICPARGGYNNTLFVAHEEEPTNKNEPDIDRMTCFTLTCAPCGHSDGNLDGVNQGCENDFGNC